jgi:hypothetical protein
VLASSAVNVSYTESLAFWLIGLDVLHAGLDGACAVAIAETLNSLLAGNVENADSSRMSTDTW